MDLLGCSSPGKIIGGTWSFQERKWHINELELLAVKLALQTFQNFTSHLNKIYIFEKNGGNQESENDYTLKRDLANINFRTDHDYCGVPTQHTQQSGGLGIFFFFFGLGTTGLLQYLP